ncbi:MAG: molybdenum cofactor guanylyltransferase MobA [Salaquimonas sp.]
MTDLSGQNIIGVVLAGGLSRRMEGPEKALMDLHGKPLLQRVCERLETQLPKVILNANGDPSRFSFMPNPVQADVIEGYAGPLAGLLSAMKWAKHNAPDATRIITVAADTPFFPADLVNRFCETTENASKDQQDQTICLAYSDGNRHPVFGSWPISLFEPLKHFLVDENNRKVMLFAQRYNLKKVEFELFDIEDESIDPFFNINTPEDFNAAEKLLKRISA